MSTVRKVFSFLTSVIERKPVGRRERVQCRPSGEQMEPRALQSALKADVATLVAPHTVGGTLVTGINQAPSFHVTYPSIHVEQDIKDQINIEN
jgi:hypothetical protein